MSEERLLGESGNLGKQIILKHLHDKQNSIEAKEGNRSKRYQKLAFNIAKIKNSDDDRELLYYIKLIEPCD